MRVMVTPTGWEPIDAEARAEHASLTIGGLMDIDLLHDRDMHEHRRIMACINDLAKALHASPEKVRAELLVATGNFTLLGELLGTPMCAVNSMSRHNMKDHELHAFWDEAKLVIQSKLLEKISDPAERQRLADTLSLQPA